MPSLALHTGILGKRLAKHLLRRCSFNHSVLHVNTMATLTADQAVEALLGSYQNYRSEPLNPYNGKPWINDIVNGETLVTNNQGPYRDYVAAWWLDEARRDQTINHKMQWFLHSIFITSHEITNSLHSFDYHKIIEAYALGNLKEFAYKISISNLMLRYLDGYANTKNSPNENYAREFLELFTLTKGPQIGQGNYTYYTEDDVQTAAKLLTGFRMTTRNMGVNPSFQDPISGAQLGTVSYSQHTTGNKTFSQALGGVTINGATNGADMYRELQDFVNLVFAQEQTAISYALRLYRFFVNNNIDAGVHNDIIIPLANTLRSNNYELAPVLRQLLKSQHFFGSDDGDLSNNTIGTLIRSPIELLLHTMTFFDLDPPDPNSSYLNHYHNWYQRSVITNLFRSAGFEIYAPENVAGYPAYYQEPGYSRYWFNGSTLIARYKMIEILLTGNRVLLSGNNGGVQLNCPNFVRNSGYFSNPVDSGLLVDEFLAYVFVETPNSERRQYFLNILLDDLSPINWMMEWNNYISTNSATSVKVALDRFVKAVFSSQEYQLY
jgi:uncharacterized protein (DUF1800 family)